MQRHPITITPEAPIEEAARVMCEHKIGGLVVVREETPVGLITESDIFRAFVSLFGLPQAGTRITFDMGQGEDVFGLLGRVAPKWGVRVVSVVSSQQDDRPVCVVRVTGAAVDGLVDDLWSTGHHVLSVIRSVG
jgi:acetoin utilization protein AcuB